ncbi:electron transfer flavoprotein subunit beta/FixA family protein [Amantichitinum ursilacus]|uniref:Electron transfer flavoprotein subunit beta n=1 Tax=Amantichitinum ursilacus TaxID=857265 RepID=A0A0N0XL36_9NEIS|nr:electron transfer flavoprotein subunit beta/FixA family protein [Amantichitinum ursilacus]KPC52970.1 Electron transfer flavoprotein subunit beta [Amantichitinum ursilacus]
MKILVAVKRVVDANVKVRLKADGSDVDVGAAKMSMNPFDENAVEAAVRLKEAGQASEIVAVSVGPAGAQDTLRHALAMGADRAILIDSGDVAIDALSSAKLLRQVAEREQPQLILLGKQAIDEDAAVVGPMLAALLNRPQAVAASQITVESADTLTVVREIEGGQQTVRVPLPAVVTADLRLNEPRYVKLPNLMQARKKPIETLTPEALGVTLSAHHRLLGVNEPPARAAGQRVNSVEELINRLRADTRVLP